jgi:hypothetical protein
MKLAIVGLVSIVAVGLATSAARAGSGYTETETQACNTDARSSIAAAYDAGLAPMANLYEAGVKATGTSYYDAGATATSDEMSTRFPLAYEAGIEHTNKAFSSAAWDASAAAAWDASSK